MEVPSRAVLKDRIVSAEATVKLQTAAPNFPIDIHVDRSPDVNSAAVALRVSRGFVVRIVGPLLIMFFTGAAAELALRLPSIERTLPIPGRGIGLSTLDVNAELNERFVAREGGVLFC